MRQRVNTPGGPTPGGTTAGRGPRWLGDAVLACLAAWPSLLYALRGGAYLSDDFWVAGEFHRNGVIEAMHALGFSAPARPLVGPYFAFIYEVIGERAVLQCLLLALLNAAAALLARRAFAELVDPRAALLGALAFATIANRGSTRLWFVTGSTVLALCLVFLAVIVLHRHHRWLLASVLSTVAVFLHEATGALTVAALLWWAWQGDSRQRRQGIAACVPPLAAMGLAFVLSPKRGGDGLGIDAFDNVNTLGPAILGSAVWGDGPLATIGAVALLLAAAVAAASLLPSFRTRHRAVAAMRAGLVVAVIGALPFALAGAPYGAQGIFDRNNLLAGVGVCLLIGGAVLSAERVHRHAPLALIGAISVWFSVLSIADVDDYRAAVVEGERLVAQVLADVDPDAGVTIVVPPLEGADGVSQFILDGELTMALVMRHGEAWYHVDMPRNAVRCEAMIRDAQLRGVPARFYDRERRTFRAAEEASCVEILGTTFIG